MHTVFNLYRPFHDCLSLREGRVVPPVGFQEWAAMYYLYGDKLFLVLRENEHFDYPTLPSLPRYLTEVQAGGVGCCGKSTMC